MYTWGYKSISCCSTNKNFQRKGCNKTNAIYFEVNPKRQTPNPNVQQQTWKTHSVLLWLVTYETELTDSELFQAKGDWLLYECTVYIVTVRNSTRCIKSVYLHYLTFVALFILIHSQEELMHLDRQKILYYVHYCYLSSNSFLILRNKSLQMKHGLLYFVRCHMLLIWNWIATDIVVIAIPILSNFVHDWTVFLFSFQNWCCHNCCLHLNSRFQVANCV